MKPPSNEELLEKIERLTEQVADLIRLLGFCGYKGGTWVVSESPIITMSDIISVHKEKQPATKKDFNMLLEFLGIEFVPEEKVPEKVIPSKLIKKAKKE